jgi:hypothetical protein
MRKAAYPSGGMGSSNPCRWRGKRLHHGGGVCLVCVFLCRLVWSSSLVVCLAGKVANMLATCRPDSQKSALLADLAKSCRHKFVPDTFFVSGIADFL